MKLKKKVKNTIVIVLVIIVAILIGLVVLNHTKKSKTKEVKVVDKIDKYGYKLKETKTDTYKKMFKELKDILSKEKVNQEDYVKKISEMFVYDFYSLKDKLAKTDIGGVDFLYPAASDNFLLNAQDTYYKYVESNIYGNRNQDLPEVDKIEIKDVSQKAFAYQDKTDEEAYFVDVSWSYKDDKFTDYQKNATLVLIHDDIKLCLVELQ